MKRNIHFVLFFLFISFGSFSQEKIEHQDTLRKNETVLEQSLSLQMIAAQNIQTATEEFHKEIEHYEFLFKSFLAIASLLGLSQLIGFSIYTYKFNDKLKVIEAITNEAKNKLKSIETQEVSISSINEHVSNQKIEIDSLKHSLIKLTKQIELQQKIEYIKRNFSSEIIDEGIKFNEVHHQIWLRNINTNIEELEKEGLQVLPKYYYYKGCFIISDAYTKGKIDDKVLEQSREQFEKTITLSPEFYFEAYDAKEWTYAKQPNPDFKKALEIANDITENYNFYRINTVLRKISYLNKLKDQTNDLKEKENYENQLEVELEILKGLDYDEYLRNFIEYNIQKEDYEKALIKINKGYNFLVNQQNLGLVGKVFLVNKDYENAREQFNKAIKKFSIKKDILEKKEKKNEEDFNEIKQKTIGLAANKLGLAFCEMSQNDNKEFYPKIAIMLNEVFTLEPRFKNKEGLAKLYSTFGYYFTKEEVELWNKAISIYRLESGENS
ncbi:MAG: hypothetical protein WCK82_09060 [Bacteroidota bacterium]